MINRMYHFNSLQILLSKSKLFVRLIFIIFGLLTFSQNGNCCDGSSITIDNITDNGDGTYTVNITFTVEYGALDSGYGYYGSVFQFSNLSSVQPNVLNFSPSTLNPTEGLIETLIGSSPISNLNNNTLWEPYIGLTNAVSWEYEYDDGDAAFDDFSHSISVTLDNCFESITFLANPGSGDSNCEYIINSEQSCSIPQSPCECESPNCEGIYYPCDTSAESNFPENGGVENFSPGLPAPVGATYQFCHEYTTLSDETVIGFVNLVGTHGTSSCTEKTYEVFQSNDCTNTIPPIGPASFGINGHEYSVLPNTSYSFCVNVEVINSNCFEIFESSTWLYGECNIGCGNCTIPCAGDGLNTVSDYESRTFESCWSPEEDILSPASFTNCFEATSDQEGFLGFTNQIYISHASDCEHIIENISWSLSDSCGVTIANPITNANGVVSGFNPEYNNLSSNTPYILCITYELSDVNCVLNTDSAICIDAYGATECLGCGQCDSPCTQNGMGIVPSYDDRVFSSCWIPDCEIFGPTSFTNCFEATADENGFLGFANGIFITGTPGCVDITWELTDGCGESILSDIDNANGVGSGFNPEYSGLIPNGTYILCVTYSLPDIQCGFDGLYNLICIDAYGSDCNIFLNSEGSNGFACKDDGIPIEETISWSGDTNADQIAFIVFCDPPVLPLTEAYYNANAFDSFFELNGEIGSNINLDGFFVDSINQFQTCSDKIYVLPITIAAFGNGVFTIDWNCLQTGDIYEVGIGVSPTALATANPTNICNSESTTLTATGGDSYVWSNGLGSNSIIEVTPSFTTTYEVTVSNNSGNCFNTAEVTISVDTSISPSFDPYAVYCEGETIPNLPTTSNEGISGTWSPAINNTLTTTYTFTPDTEFCANETTIIIEIISAELPIFSIITDYCDNDEIEPLPNISNNGYSGVWSPNSIDASYSNTSTFTFTPNDNCVEEYNIEINIFDCDCVAPAFANIENIDPICEGESTSLEVILGGSATSGIWTTNGDGDFDSNISLTPEYTPSTSDIANGKVTLVFTTNDPDGSGPCSQVQDNVELLINTIIAPSFNSVGPYCLNQNIPNLPNISLEGISGTWSPELNNTTTTTYTFTPDAGLCALETSTLTVEIQSDIIPTFDPYPLYCQGESIPNLPPTSNEGITGFWTPAINNMETTTYTFIPNENLCSDQTTFEIEITSEIIPTFEPIGPFIAGTQISALTNTSLEGISGTWNPALNNTSTTNYTFIPDDGQCAITTVMTIIIQPNNTNDFISYTFLFRDQFGNEITDVDIFIGDTNNSFKYQVPSDDTLKIYSLENEYPGVVNPIFQFEKEGNAIEGISALDLITLRKHILGIDSITDVDIFTAGDVNDNASISAVDMITLQKIILGIENDFPNNLSNWIVKNNNIPINNVAENHSHIVVKMIKRGNVRE